MERESFFDESDFQRIRAKAAQGGIRSEIHIPRACLSCDGEPRRDRNCLGVDCPIFSVHSEPDDDHYILDFLEDRRLLREALLEARTLKESLRKATLFCLAR